MRGYAGAPDAQLVVPFLSHMLQLLPPGFLVRLGSQHCGFMLAGFDRAVAALNVLVIFSDRLLGDVPGVKIVAVLVRHHLRCDPQNATLIDPLFCAEHSHQQQG